MFNTGIVVSIFTLVYMFAVETNSEREVLFEKTVLMLLTGACPRLESIEVHIGISDYFTDVEDVRNKKKYRRIVKKLTV